MKWYVVVHYVMGDGQTRTFRVTARTIEDAISKAKEEACALWVCARRYLVVHEAGRWGGE